MENEKTLKFNPEDMMKAADERFLEKINKEKGRVLDTNKIFNDGSGNVNIHRAFEDFKRWMPQST